jgi:hypothetical protein
MKEKHTPGPWKHVATDGGWDGVGSKDGLICNLALNNPANAALIAAAPDLLAVCQMVARTRRSDAWGNCVDAAKAAVEKAEGK